MKKYFILFVLILLIGGIGLFMGSESKRTPVKIGVILSLTGKGAYLGQADKNVVQMAADRLAKKYGPQVRIIVEDSQSDPTGAANAANKLINVDRVDGLVTILTGPSGAVSPIALAANKPYIYSAFLTDILAKNPLAIKTFLGYKDSCKIYIQKHPGINKVAIMDEGNSAGDCINGLAAAGFDSKHVSVVRIKTGDDLRSIVLKLKNDKVDSLVFIGYEGTAINMLKAKREVNFQGKVFCNKQNCATQKIVQTIGKDGMRGITYFESKVSPVFIRQYNKRFNQSATAGDLQVASFTYDSVISLTEAVIHCPRKDNSCIIKQVTTIPVTESAVQAYTFQDRSVVPNLEFVEL